MEEKTDYTYDAKIKFSTAPAFTPINFGETSPEIVGYQIDEMSQLQPMTVKWSHSVGSGECLVFLDFYTEKVYDKHFSDMGDTNLGKAILEILKEKKSKMQGSHVPEGLIQQALATRNNVFEGRPDARTL